jgi:hypothetical protein
LEDGDLDRLHVAEVERLDARPLVVVQTDRLRTRRKGLLLALFDEGEVAVALLQEIGGASVSRVEVPARNTRLGSSYPAAAATGCAQLDSCMTRTSAGLGNKGPSTGMIKPPAPTAIRTEAALAHTSACSAPSSLYNLQANSPQTMAAARNGQAASTGWWLMTIAPATRRMLTTSGATNHHTVLRTNQIQRDSKSLSIVVAKRIATAG